MTTLVLKLPLSAAVTVKPARAATLYPSMWLLTLLPVSALIVLDVVGGVFRPVVWATRLLPALLALAPIAMSLAVRTPFTVRLKKELRLSSRVAVPLMVGATLSCVVDAPLPLIARLLISTASMVTTVIGVGWLTIHAWSDEHANDTLASMVRSPRAPRLFAEKSGVVAYFAAVSALAVSGGGWMEPAVAVGVLVAHVMAIATGPALFFATRSGGAAMGAAFFVPATALAVYSLFGGSSAHGAMVASLGYSAAMLALTPRLMRTDLTEPPPPFLTNPLIFKSALNLKTGRWAIEQGLLSSAIHAMVIPPVLLALFFASASFGADEGIFATTLFLGVWVCALAPGLTLAEHPPLLAQELAVHSRRRVMATKITSSAFVAAISGLAVPGVCSMFMSLDERPLHLTGNAVIAFVLLGVVAWSVSLAFSTVVKGAASVSGLGVALTFVGAGLQLSALALGAQLASPSAHLEVFDPMTVVSAVIVIVPAAVLFAWRRFVRLTPFALRDAALLWGACLVHAAVLGAVTSKLFEAGVLPL